MCTCVGVTVHLRRKGDTRASRARCLLRDCVWAERKAAAPVSAFRALGPRVRRRAWDRRSAWRTPAQAAPRPSRPSPRRPSRAPAPPLGEPLERAQRCTDGGYPPCNRPFRASPIPLLLS